MKKKYLIISAVLSAWYVAAAACAQWGSYEHKLQGVGYIAYKIILNLGMTGELFGIFLYFIIPILFLTAAIIFCVLSKDAAKVRRTAYILPSVMLGGPALLSIIFITIQWMPFDIPISTSLVYNLLTAALWLAVCVVMLILPQKAKQG